MQEAGVAAKALKGFVSSVRLGEPRSYRNLTVFPLYSVRARENGFSMLEDAINTKKFLVTEVSEGGAVPELRVVNQLDINVLVLDGEELVGAKQNRIVNTTIVVGRGKEVVIPVSCVEQGRWHYRSKHFSSGKSNLYAELRRKKAKSVHRSLKTSARFVSDQHEIWHDISEKAACFNVKSETGAMDDIFDSYEEELKKYEEQFRAEAEQVGFVAAIGGRIVGLDIFGAKTVLPKVYAKLMRGYILDALDQLRRSDRSQSSQEKEGEKTESLHEEVKAFLKQVTAARKESFKSVGEGSELRFGNRKINGFALVNEEELVHLAAFAE